MSPRATPTPDHDRPSFHANETLGPSRRVVLIRGRRRAHGPGTPFFFSHLGRFLKFAAHGIFVMMVSNPPLHGRFVHGFSLKERHVHS